MQKELQELYNSLPENIYVICGSISKLNRVMTRDQLITWCEYHSRIQKTSLLETQGVSALDKVKNWFNNNSGTSLDFTTVE